jgi:hypothetical protein
MAVSRCVEMIRSGWNNDKLEKWFEEINKYFGLLIADFGLEK